MTDEKICYEAHVRREMRKYKRRGDGGGRGGERRGREGSEREGGRDNQPVP